MAVNLSMKIIKFIRDNDFERYKFSPAEPIESIDNSIRRRFGISANTPYILLDVTDRTMISIFSLRYLENESVVRVETRNVNAAAAAEDPPVAAS